MADTLKADIAKELNITARRNDSFQMSLQVKKADGTLEVMNAKRSSVYPNFQAKMTIINSSGDKVLSVYSYYWRDVIPTDGNTTHPDDAVGDSSTEGHYSGVNDATMGIYLEAQTSSSSTTQAATIYVPHAYMGFQSGTYKYDLQIRKQTTGSVGSETDAEYTTWLYGDFILNADITQV
tara:strand:+ start:176 stop:712 length:537 start_codon:yes stop_codon:yes gene_type:complete